MSIGNVLKKISILVLALVSVTVVYAATTTYVYLRSVGTVKAIGIGVYWDSECEHVVSSIDWGMAEPGAVKNVTVFIRNEGNAPVTLFLETVNWNPENAAEYITLDWDYASQALSPREVIAVNLTLTVSPSIEGITSFSFDIIISAVG